MSRRLREWTGALLVAGSLGTLWLAILHVRDQEFVSAVLLVTIGISLLRGGVELLRPSIGE